MEYFVADYIINTILDCIDKIDENGIDVDRVNRVLGNFNLTMEVCLFINDILELKKDNVLDGALDYFESFNDITKENLLSIIAKNKKNLPETFSKYNISNRYIPYIDFSHAEFNNYTIENVFFINSNFYKANFDNVCFVNCVFQNVSFDKACLRDVKFVNCKFYYSFWNDSKIQKCEFTIENSDDEEISYKDESQKCILVETVWRNSVIIKCKFEYCDCSDSVFDAMVITDSNFENVDFTGTVVKSRTFFDHNSRYRVYGEPEEFNYGWIDEEE
jgi:uncharacterized protein YjbI with pentapeptide repeats